MNDWQKLYADRSCVGCNPVAVANAAREEIARLRHAIEFAHSEGFQWPSDPLPPSSKTAK